MNTPTTYTAADVEQAAAEIARAKAQTGLDARDWALICHCERALAVAQRAMAVSKLRQAADVLRPLRGNR